MADKNSSPKSLLDNSVYKHLKEIRKKIKKKDKNDSLHKPRMSYEERKRQRVRQVRRTYALIAAGVIVVCGIIGFFIFPDKDKENLLSDSVLQYEKQVKKYCREYEISEYWNVVMAMMQQESAGQGTDVMQCSESPFNKQFSNEPGSISDTDYSIQVGAETFAYCLERAGATSVKDMGGLKLALQEYNFGNDYAQWAIQNYGNYTPENALEFSEKMKNQLGWATYGDPQYVEHVLRYYNGK